MTFLRRNDVSVISRYSGLRAGIHRTVSSMLPFAAFEWIPDNAFGISGMTIFYLDPAGQTLRIKSWDDMLQVCEL